MAVVFPSVGMALGFGRIGRRVVRRRDDVVLPLGYGEKNRRTVVAAGDDMAGIYDLRELRVMAG